MDEADETHDLDEIGECLKVLWKAKSIEKTWIGEMSSRSSSPLSITSRTLTARQDRLHGPDQDGRTKDEMDVFQKDALYARVRTSGIVTRRPTSTAPSSACDVGGQRNERAGIHCSRM